MKTPGLQAFRGVTFGVGGGLLLWAVILAIFVLLSGCIPPWRG